MAGKKQVNIAELTADGTRYKRTLNQLEGDTKRSAGRINKSWQSTARSFRNLASAAIGAVAVREVAQLTTELIKLAGSARGVEAAFKKLNRPGLLENLRKATRNTVSDLQLMQTAVQAKNFKIPLGQLATYLEFVQKRATETGQSVDYLVESIITGLGRKSVLILDNLGISASELQQEVKKVGDFGLAAGNIIRRELGNMGDVAETAADRVQQINAQWENMKVRIGEAILPVANTLLPLLTRVVNGMLFIGKNMTGASLKPGSVNFDTQLAFFNQVKDYTDEQVRAEKENLMLLMKQNEQRRFREGISRKQREQLSYEFDLLYAQWQILDDMKKARDTFAPPSVDGGMTEDELKAAEKLAKEKEKAFQKMFDELGVMAEGYRQYREEQIDKEYEKILKLTNDTVNAEKWKNEQLKALNDEFKSFYDDPLQIAFGLDNDMNDEAFAKFDEWFAQQQENEMWLKNIKISAAKDTNDIMLDGVNSFANALSRASNQFGDSFLGYISQAVQMIGGIVRSISSFTSEGGGGIGGFFGLIGSFIPGLASGGPAFANRPHIVGEDGPELFIPNNSGTVIPSGVTKQIVRESSGAGNEKVVNAIYAMNDNISRTGGQRNTYLLSIDGKVIGEIVQGEINKLTRSGQNIGDL